MTGKLLGTAIAVASLLLLALDARAQTKTAATYRDRDWGFSIDVPSFDAAASEPYGRVAEFTELAPGGSRDARTLLRVVVRKPSSLQAERDNLLASLGKKGHRIGGEKTVKIAEREATLVEHEGKERGADVRFLTAVVVDKACTVQLACESAPGAYAAVEKALRASIDSLRFGPADAGEKSAPRYRHATFGFSIEPPAFANARVNEPSVVFLGCSGDGKARVTVALRKNVYASKKALRDFLVSAYEKAGTKVVAERFTTVSGRDAVELDLMEKENRRIATHVLDEAAVYVASAYCASAEFAARESHLRAAVGSLRFDRVDPAPPVLAAPFAARPAFTIDGAETSAGHAFAVRWRDEKRLLILTAQHVFGDGTDPTDVPPDKLPAKVKEVRLADLATGELLGKTTETLALAGAYPLRAKGESWDCTGDVAAFWAPAATKLKPLALATELPRSGERIWLACQPAEDPGAAKLYPIRVIEVRDGLMLLGRHETLQQAQLRATSGAPIVNAKGEVVGVNVGGTRHVVHGQLAFVNPVTTVRKLLEANLK